MEFPSQSGYPHRIKEIESGSMSGQSDSLKLKEENFKVFFVQVRTLYINCTLYIKCFDTNCIVRFKSVHFNMPGF